MYRNLGQITLFSFTTWRGPREIQLAVDIVPSSLILYNLLITFHTTMNVVCSSVGLKGTVPVMRLIENDLAPSAVDTQFAKEAVTIADIWKAHKLLKPRLHHTPLE